MPIEAIDKKQVFGAGIIASTKEQVLAQKVWWMHTMPYVLGATICWGLSEQALIQPAARVTWIVSKFLDAGMFALMLKGAFNFFVQLDKKNATLQGRKIEKIEISKKDFVAMQEEILRLKEEAIRLQKENSLFREKDVILEKILLPNQKKDIQLLQETVFQGKSDRTQCEQGALEHCGQG